MRNKVQSLDRALEILRLLGSEPEMRVTDLARRLEVHKSTVFRLLSTLQEHGLVEQNPATEKYRLGYGLVRLASSVVGEIGDPHLGLRSQQLQDVERPVE